MSQIISQIDFDTSKINSGEYPTPSVLNRPLLACMDADNRLEEAVQYLVRSTALVVTDNTRFLSHCSDDGVDVIGNVPPTLSTDYISSFMYDDMFIGSAFPQSAATNILGTIMGLDTSLKTLNGWSATPGSASIVIGIAGTTITSEALTTMVVSTTRVSSPSIAVTAGNIMSASVQVQTDANLDYLSMRAGLEITFYDAVGTSVGHVYSEYNTNKLSGILVLESSTVPVGAVNAVLGYYVGFDSTASIGAVIFKNAMLEVSPVAHTYIANSRRSNTIEYVGAVNGEGTEGTLICWTKFNILALLNHSGPIGPIFLASADSTFVIGAVHEASYGGTIQLRLRCINNGVTSYGSIISIPDNNLNQYTVCVLRYGTYTLDGVTSIKVEFSMIDQNLAIHKSSIEVTDGSIVIPARMSIRVGSDLVSTDYYNCPVSEIRYDVEWINDMELLVMALSRKPFSIGSDADYYIKLFKNYIDNTEQNLILNPDGRLSTYHWDFLRDLVYVGPAKTSGVGLDSTRADKVYGSCLTWAGTAANYLIFNSAKISVDINSNVTLRGKIYSSSDTTGEIGIGIILGQSDGTYTMSSTSPIVNGKSSSYYTVTTLVQSGTIWAAAALYVKNGAHSSGVSFGRLKLELGITPTAWTDDTTPKYAVYAD